MGMNRLKKTWRFVLKNIYISEKNARNKKTAVLRGSPQTLYFDF